MQTPWLFLLVLLRAPTSDAVRQDNNLLAGIVSAFKAAAANKGEATIDTDRQFAFLMALTAADCADSEFKGFVPKTNGQEPLIKDETNFFLTVPDANYMAVYPNYGRRCAESKLLITTVPFKQVSNEPTAAIRFQNLLNNRLGEKGLEGGCIILYTTYTPCIDRCFSDKDNCEILTPLRNEPFKSIWEKGNIQKYFVFSEVYGNDNNANKYVTIRNKLGEIANAGFHIRKCDGEPIRCNDCSTPEYCIGQTAQ